MPGVVASLACVVHIAMMYGEGSLEFALKLVTRESRNDLAGLDITNPLSQLSGSCNNKIGRSPA